MRNKKFLFLGILIIIFLINNASANHNVWIQPPLAFCNANVPDCWKTIDNDWANTWWIPAGQNANFLSVIDFSFPSNYNIAGVQFKPTWPGVDTSAFGWSARPTATLNFWDGASFQYAASKNPLDFMLPDGTIPAPVIYFPQVTTTQMQIVLSPARYCTGALCSGSCTGICNMHDQYDGLYEIMFLCNANDDPVTCSGKVCGTATNNCGQAVNCGTCSSGYCNNGACVQCTTNPDCVSLSDSCNDGICNAAHACVKQPKSGNPSCSSDICKIGQTCSAGVCQGGSAKCSSGQTCDSGNCIDAHNCLSPDDTIMKLYNSKNSHGALWNDGFYGFSICYNDTFGIPYNGGINPHACNSNKVIGLSATTDAHGEIPTSNNYLTNVCYGDLVCRVTSSPNFNEKLILRLFQNTNSHISNESDSNYPIKIYCSSAYADANTLGNIYWASLMNSPINNADINDTVLMTINMNPLLIAGKIINYTVFKKGVLGDTIVNKIAINNSFAQYITNDIGTYYFTADILNSDGSIYASLSSKDKNYGNLNVVTPINNSLPQTQIINPAKESHYVMNNLISFTQKSTDVDDDLRLTWNFGDGNITSFDNAISRGIGNTTHIYSTTGTKIIRLTAQEMTRNQNVMDSSRIYIHKPGLSVFSKIDSPDYQMMMVPPGTYLINGTSSYVENCSYASYPSTGLGSCYDIIDSIGNPLHCKKLKDSSALVFTWVFDGTPYNGVINNTPFLWYFPGPQQHVINLNVNYNF